MCIRDRLGIVENMSYIVCPDCGKKISVFGESHVDEVAAKPVSYTHLTFRFFRVGVKVGIIFSS